MLPASRSGSSSLHRRVIGRHACEGVGWRCRRLRLELQGAWEHATAAHGEILLPPKCSPERALARTTYRPNALRCLLSCLSARSTARLRNSQPPSPPGLPVGPSRYLTTGAMTFGRDGRHTCRPSSFYHPCFHWNLPPAPRTQKLVLLQQSGTEDRAG